MKKATVIEKQNDKNAVPDLAKLNLWLAGAHALQGIVILLLSATKLFPVTTSYLTADPVSSELAGHAVINTATKHLFDVNLAVLVAAFFFIAALGHLIVATVYRQQYEADLKKKLNRLRWVEFGLGAGVMMVAVAVLSGVTDISSLFMIFALKVIADLSLLGMDVYNQGKTKLNWLAGVVGLVAGLVPFVVLAVYVWGANVYGSGDIPGFTYAAYGALIAGFGALAFNAYLQYNKQGKWKDFLYGERMFMFLGLAVKTALAWVIFAGALRP